MTSIIKVNNIQNSSGTAAVSIDGSSNVTFPQNATITGNTTFNGTVTGSSMDLLLSHENNSSSPDPSPAYYDISSTYINSTYDNYYLVGYFEGNADTRYFQCQVFVGGILQTGSSYYGENRKSMDFTNTQENNNQSPELFTAQTEGMGGEDGEGCHVSMVFQNANYTQAPFSVNGISTYHNVNAAHQSAVFSGSVKVSKRAEVVNGIRLKMHSGDLTNFKFRFYGLKD